MLDVVNYREDSKILVGENIRNSLNFGVKQRVYIYEDTKNAQLILCKYKLSRFLYSSTIIINKIEDFVKLGKKISDEGIDMFHNSFYKYGTKFRMIIEFELTDKAKPEWMGENCHSKFKDAALECNIGLSDFCYYSHKTNEKGKIYSSLIELCDGASSKCSDKCLDEEKQYKFYYGLTDEFRKRANLEKGKLLKCLQVTDPDTGLLMMTFHKPNLTKIRIDHRNLSGALVRIINILNYLDMKIEASETHAFQRGDFAASSYAIKHSDKIENDQQLELRIKKADANLVKTNADHQQIVNSHNILLDQIGRTDFFKKIEIEEDSKRGRKSKD